MLLQENAASKSGYLLQLTTVDLRGYGCMLQHTCDNGSSFSHTSGLTCLGFVSCTWISFVKLIGLQCQKFQLALQVSWDLGGTELHRYKN